MKTDDSAFALLNGFLDPVIIVDGSADIVACNPPARKMLSEDAIGRPLGEFVSTDGPAVSKVLKLWSGSGTPRPHALIFRTRDHGCKRIKCLGSRLAPSGAGEPKLILIHCNDIQSKRLSVLTSSLQMLRQEIKARRQAQAMAEEALRDRDLMLRELQHRVKNNIQVVTALMRNSLREVTSPEARAIIEETYTRLAAATTVQQLLYRTAEYRTIDPNEIFEGLIAGLAGWIGEKHSVNFYTDKTRMPNDAALPLALIANELITNSIKHGCGAEGTAEVEVTLTARDKRITLVVSDTGPGYEVGDYIKRASGIGLIRGLVRQLGGTVHIGSENGSTTTIEFEVDD